MPRRVYLTEKKLIGDIMGNRCRMNSPDHEIYTTPYDAAGLNIRHTVIIGQRETIRGSS